MINQFKNWLSTLVALFALDLMRFYDWLEPIVLLIVSSLANVEFFYTFLALLLFLILLF